MDENQLIAVGIIVAPHGIKGEVRIDPLTVHKQRFAKGSRFIAMPENQTRELVIEQSRRHKGQVIAKFAGIDDRNAAEALRHLKLFIPEEEVLPLPEGQYYHFQIVGLSVYTSNGEYKGRVSEVLTYAANDVYVVKSPNGQEYFIPALKELITEINLADKKMVVVPREGLF